MQISVVIPTFNRCRTLKECLSALYDQDLPQKSYEIIVVDDGSKDETKEVVEFFIKQQAKAEKRDEDRAKILYLRQKNQGQGVARSNGIEKAKGEIIVLIGDDIMVKKNFLSEHARLHLRHPAENEAVLGLTLWHPKLTLTPFMEWTTNGSSVFGRFGGHQFAYEKLKDKELADYNFFYTSNISLKRSLLDKYPFDPEFSGYGWEDIELGYRLHKKVGLKLYYNADAVGYHDHAMTVNSLAHRMRNIGASAHVFHRKYPELKKVPSSAKKTVFRLLGSGPVLFVLKFLRNLTQGKVAALYYYALSKKYFLEGLDSWRSNGRA